MKFRGHGTIFLDGVLSVDFSKGDFETEDEKMIKLFIDNEWIEVIYEKEEVKSTKKK